MSILGSCTGNGDKADGYGNFEATEITISAEANGKILFLDAEEGNVLAQNEVVGVIDTVQLSLKRDQLLASKNTIFSKSRNVLSQREVLKEQLKVAQNDKARVENLLQAKAATTKQLDDINGQINIIIEQIKSVETQNSPIINEINAFGKPLYKIANLEDMILRVYISENQLSTLKIGQEVSVKIDAGQEMISYPGVVSWIAESAEFTPKIIQTKEERVNLVYT